MQHGIQGAPNAAAGRVACALTLLASKRMLMWATSLGLTGASLPALSGRKVLNGSRTVEKPCLVLKREEYFSPLLRGPRVATAHSARMQSRHA